MCARLLQCLPVSKSLWNKCAALASLIAMANREDESVLLQKVSEIYHAISKLPFLSPSDEVNKLFSDLVAACIPPSSIDVSVLSAEVQGMRRHLIELCAEAEGLLESHYSDLLASYTDPLRHLHLFPYYPNYLKLAQLEFALLSRHVPALPARVAFVGSGSLPLSSLVLAARHMPAAQLHNYDLDPAANARARRLVRGDAGLAARMEFRSADVLSVTQELRGYDAVFLAALVGVAPEEKVRAVEHLARHMAPGAVLVARSATGARAFLYPVVEPAELTRRGFEVLTVHHPEDEVINSVVIARKPQTEGHAPAGGTGAVVVRPCKCCNEVMVEGSGHFRHGCVVEEVSVLEQLKS